jgi:hypothetical protein
MLLLVLLGCGADTCYQLCATTAQALEPCLSEWGATWEDFDAASRVAWGDRCRRQWDDERVNLQLRQIEVASGACEDASLEIADLECDELRAIYFDP